MTRREDLPYRDCVGAAVFNREGRVFIGRRKPDQWSEDRSEFEAPWQMPQGGLEKGEEPRSGALRELFEETSIKAVTYVAEIARWIHYDLPDEAIGVALKGKYRGQRQRWFAFRFVGVDDEINVHHPGDGSMPAEFDAWRWETLERLPDLIVPFKRQAYREIVAGFADVPRQVRGL